MLYSTQEENEYRFLKDNYKFGSNLGNLDSSGKLTGTIPRLLSNVGLRLKTLVQSDSTDVEANKKLLGCALGNL